MATTPAWCFDIEIDTIKTLSDKAAAFEEELFIIHEAAPKEEWESTIEEWGLEDEGGFEKILTKPSWEDFYNFKNEEHSIDLFKQTRSELEPLKANQLLLVRDLNILIKENLDKVHPSLIPSLEQFTNPNSWQNKTISDFNRYIDSLVAEVTSSPQESEESDSETGTTPPDIATILASIADNLSIFRREIGSLVPAATKCPSITDLTELWKQEFKKLALPFVDDQAIIDLVDENKDGVISEEEREKASQRGYGPALDRAQENLARLEEQADIVSLGGAEAIIFREQCFLLANLGLLVDNKKELPDPLPLPYVAGVETETEESAGGLVAAPLESVQTERNQPLHIQGEAFGFMNKLAVDPSQARLFDLKPHEISSITPHMRFYKVTSDDEGKDVETEIIFDTNVKNDLTQYMGRGGRGLGVGVKSFTFSYDGTDPFSAKKSISAKLSIYATSFTELLREREHPKGDKFRYIDLALKTGRLRKSSEPSLDELTEIQKENLEKLNFRLKAVVEWAATNSNLKLVDQRVKDAIYDSAISIYLTPTIHEFDFDETGAVTFDINYLAYIEDYFASPSFDVFSSVTNDKIARNLVYDYFREQGCEVETGPDFAEFRKKDELFVSSVNANSLSSIIRGLRKKQKIYYFKVKKEEMIEWLRFPSSTSFDGEVSNSAPVSDDLVKKMQDEGNKAGEEKDKQKKAAQISLVANSDALAGVSFFYLSDLISIVMNNLETSLEKTDEIIDSSYLDLTTSELQITSEINKYVKDRIKKDKIPKLKATYEQFKKLRIILGPMEVYPYKTTQTATPAISCTVGDIPISLNYFLDFMSEKVLAKQITQYPLSKFIKDVINDAIRNFLNSDDCFATNSSQKINLNSTTILGYNTKEGTGAKDDITALILEEMAKNKGAAKNCLLSSKITSNLPIIKISGPRGQPRSQLSIDKMINYYVFSAGRRYPTDLYVGNKKTDSDKGIFHYLLGENKGIVKNIRLDKTTAPGLKELRFEQEGYDGLTQLREVYNANVETFLNPQTFPGTYIYVEPKGFDPTATEDLTRFGIGGYYMIIKTTHTIAPGNAETQINAAWVASKGNNKIPNDPREEAKRQEEGSEKVKKCRVQTLSSTRDTR